MITETLGIVAPSVLGMLFVSAHHTKSGHDAPSTEHHAHHHDACVAFRIILKGAVSRRPTLKDTEPVTQAKS